MRHKNEVIAALVCSALLFATIVALMIVSAWRA